MSPPKDEPTSSPPLRRDMLPRPDLSQTRRVAPVEVFKDPLAEELLDIKKLNTGVRRRRSPTRRGFA